MTIATQRDSEAAEHTLARWLLEKAGARVVERIEVTPAKSGFSNETLLCGVCWVDAVGQRFDDELVLRIEPTRHQLFPSSDALLQAAVMQTLDREFGFPVPRVRFTESDTSWFGAAFYLMDRVTGRVPTDVPSYHKRGWVAELTVGDRARLYDNALRHLADLHRLDWRPIARVLKPPTGSSPLQNYVEHVRAWAKWTDADLQVNRSDVLDALRYVERARPPEGDPVVVWGDARVGNMIFDDDLGVAAILDWESATVGPAGIDVGWWLMFEEYICEAGGLTRLEGIPGRDEILARYESLTGAPVVDIAYYEVLAALVFSLINSRLATLLRGAGFDEQAASRFAERSTGLLARGLDAANA